MRMWVACRMLNKVDLHYCVVRGLYHKGSGRKALTGEEGSWIVGSYDTTNNQVMFIQCHSYVPCVCVFQDLIPLDLGG
jgi:hypothetical protein